MEIAVCTLATKEIESYSRFTLENKKEYCDRNRYDLICETEVLDNSRPAPWSKLLLVKKVIQSGKFDYVCWIDADMWIFNMDLKLEDLFDNKHLLFISNDTQGPNTGIFAFKSCSQSVKIIDDWYNRTKFINHRWWENAAVHEWFNEGVNKMVVKLIYKTIWNSYLNEMNGNTNIVHLAGEGEKERINFFSACAKREIN